MSILLDLQNIKPLSSSSISSVINLSNDNFKKISQAMYSFLINIVYDETNNNLSINKLFTNDIEINKSIQMIVNSNTMFSVNEYGKVYSKSFVTESTGEMKRLRLREFPDYPAIGIDGEIIFDGEDFMGYILGRGWVSLTGGTGGGNYADGWLGGILGFYSSPPTPTSYARYIVDWRVPATGDFAGHEGQLAIWNYDELIWYFYSPQEGAGLVDQTDSNAVWVSEGAYPNITWIKITIGDGILSYKNRNMPALTTVADGDLACNIGILETPFYSSDISVFVNGIQANLGVECYFADPLTPAIPRVIGSAQLGDKLYWIGSAAGFELITTDRITFQYLTNGVSGSGGGTNYHNELLGINGGGGSPFEAWHLTEAEYLQVISGGNTKYINAAVMPETIGGYPAGTSFPTEKTVQQMFDGLLYPYQEPAMTISSTLFITYEVGQNLPVGHASVNYNITNATNIKTQPPDVGVQSTTIAGLIFLTANPINLAASGTLGLSVPPGITRLIETTETITLQGTNTQNNSFSDIKTLYWRHKRYWGVNANTSLVDADILALSSEFSTTRSKGFILNGTGKYIYYCYPASWGLATFTVGGLTVVFNLTVQSFINASGHAEMYNVYRSLNIQFGTGINVVVS